MNYITRNGYDIDDPEIDEDGLEVLAESRETRVKTSRRPLRSVLYYMKGYESSISLTPVQLPARSKILQVRDMGANSCMYFIRNILENDIQYQHKAKIYTNIFV